MDDIETRQVCNQRFSEVRVLHSLIIGHYNDYEWFNIKKLVKLVPDTDYTEVDSILQRLVKYGVVEAYPEYAPGEFRIIREKVHELINAPSKSRTTNSNQRKKEFCTY
jgi:hypothetical protein